MTGKPPIPDTTAAITSEWMQMALLAAFWSSPRREKRTFSFPGSRAGWFRAWYCREMLCRFDCWLICLRFYHRGSLKCSRTGSPAWTSRSLIISGGVDLDLNHLVVHLGRGSYSTTFTLLVPQFMEQSFLPLPAPGSAPAAAPGPRCPLGPPATRRRRPPPRPAERVRCPATLAAGCTGSSASASAAPPR